MATPKSWTTTAKDDAPYGEPGTALATDAREFIESFRTAGGPAAG